MKKILLYSLLLFICSKNFAQDNNAVTNDGADKVRIAQTIDALKTAYITKELNLTPEEAQKFWPVYNGFTTEIKKAKLEFKQDDIAFGEKKLALMKKYKDDFKKLLSNDDRVKRCFRAEPEFHKILRNEWQRRQGIRQQNHNPNGRMPEMIHQQGQGKPNNSKMPSSSGKIQRHQ